MIQIPTGFIWRLEDDLKHRELVRELPLFQTEKKHF